MFQTVMANQFAKSADKKDSASIELAAAIFGLTSGLLLMLTGIILSAISFVAHGNFHGWDVILLVLAFVFLAVGSHFLDKADASRKAAKIEQCKKAGMTGEQCEEYESESGQAN